MTDEPGVYVVDDDDAMRDSLDFLLGAAGFSVRVFELRVELPRRFFRVSDSDASSPTFGCRAWTASNC